MSDLYALTPTLANAGSQVAPVAGTVIADTGALPEGFYEIRAQVGYGATADIPINMAIFVGSQRITSILDTGAINSLSSEQVIPRIPVSEGAHVTVQNLAAGAAASVYLARVAATKLAV